MDSPQDIVTMPWPKALMITLLVFIYLALFIGLGGALGLKSLFSGFIFFLYWTGISAVKTEEFWPTALGMEVGVVIAYLLSASLDKSVGISGYVFAIIIIGATIFIMTKGLFKPLFNMPAMLMLTVAMIPGVAATRDFLGMGLAVLYGAAFVGGTVLIGQALAARFTKTDATGTVV